MLLAAISALFMCLCAPAVGITTEQEEAVKSICNDVIRETQDLNMRAGLVRLIFHDCVGGCNGCINHELQDAIGDFPNAGLRRYTDVLDNYFEEATTAGIESRADFWALCAAEAAESARARAGQAALGLVNKYGRTDCSTTGTTQEDSHVSLFPNPKHGLTDTLAWCDRTFNMGARECVALLGAHSLGRARVDVSGYTGPWDSTQNNLDNEFYRLMRTDNLWTQRDANRRGDQRRFQYQTTTGNRRLMLNSDICLQKDIQFDEEGREINGGIATAEESSTAQFVELYATEEETWGRDFAQVYMKMMENGNTVLETAEVVEGEGGDVGGGDEGGRGGGGRGRGGGGQGGGGNGGRRRN